MTYSEWSDIYAWSANESTNWKQAKPASRQDEQLCYMHVIHHPAQPPITHPPPNLAVYLSSNIFPSLPLPVNATAASVAACSFSTPATPASTHTLWLGGLQDVCSSLPNISV